MRQFPNNTDSLKEMSFLDHIEELRWHIIRSLIAILSLGILLYINEQWVFEKVIFGPKHKDFVTFDFLCKIGVCFDPPEFTIRAIDLGEQFFVSLKTCFMLGFVLASPYVIYQLWKFISPGLYQHEQKAIGLMVFICSFLFLIGVLFGYFVVCPLAINFLAGYTVGVDTETSPTLSSYVDYLTMLTIPLGLIFELPVVSYFLAKLGVLYSETMKNYRRVAIVAILFISAVITPPDLFSQLLVSIPMILLYEISIIIVKRVELKSV